MSKYTTELRFICEHLAGLEESEGYASVAQIIEAARPKIFNFSYPIFDEEYRPVFETKFLKHFYTQEIAAETYGLWHLWLDENMNLLMPYYNKLYAAAKIDYNPFHDVDLTRTHEGSGTSSESGTGSTTGSRSTETESSSDMLEKYADTPQGGVNGLESGKYLTNATMRNDSSEASGSETSSTSSTDSKSASSTDEYVERVTGKQGSGSYSRMFTEYRDSLLNIDQMLLNDLSNLFMQIW